MDNKPNKLQLELETAYTYLRQIPVTDEAVDLMAAARASLRRAYRMAGEAMKAEVLDTDCAQSAAYIAKEASNRG